MFLARVTGHVVATQKIGSMVGHKLLIVEPFRVKQPDRDGLQTTGRSFVAVDTLGAGIGEMVLITQGSSARLTPETRDLPIDTVVVGIVDRVHVGSAMVYGRASDGSDSTQQTETPTNEPS
jgi:ethanolamine utilization protein EutN